MTQPPDPDNLPIEEQDPDPYSLADDTDDLDWDRGAHGRMASAAAAPDEEIETVPYEPDKGD